MDICQEAYEANYRMSVVLLRYTLMLEIMQKRDTSGLPPPVIKV
jgi:uncharacterized protein YqiB (DUF1249 family)